jgi:predicted alpha/beta superfamily hydrolase
MMQKLGVLFIFVISCFASADDLFLAKSIELKSGTLSENRSILVKLPASYNSSNIKRYPVLYLLDAQDNFIHAASALDNLSKSDQIPEFILVGIIQNDRRKELSVKSEYGKKFKTFVTSEVTSFIKANYRTEKYSILSGWSASGGLVTDIASSKNTFNAYFAFSPDLSSITDKNLTTLSGDNKTIILTLANEGDSFKMPFDKIVEYFTLKEKSSINFYYKKFLEYDHQTNAVVSQLYALSKLFSGWVPTDDVFSLGLPGLKDHYEKLSTKYGFEVPIPMGLVTYISYEFLGDSSLNIQNMGLELMTYAINKDPINVNTFIQMAGAYKQRKMLKTHGFIVKNICKLQSSHAV